MALDEQSIYIFKKSIIYKATLSDTIYTLAALKSFDGKSQTTGAVNNDTVFAGGNGIFFITPDKQIMNLTRVETVDYPQIIPISENIKPTAEISSYASSTGIFWQDKAYFSVYSDKDVSNFNDAVLVWNQRIQAWESPIIGWSVGDWTVYDDGDGEELYFGSSVDANVYEVTESAVDNELGITANYRTKRFDMGSPQIQKTINNVWVDGYITANTTLTISMLINFDGFTQTYTTEFTGLEEDYLFNADSFNLFGFHPFGYEMLGSSEQAEKKRFRVYLNKKLRTIPFYTVQFEFASDGVGQYWEVLDYGVKWSTYSRQEDPALYRDFN